MYASPCAILAASGAEMILALMAINAFDDRRMACRKAGCTESLPITLTSDHPWSMAAATLARAPKFVCALAARRFEDAKGEVSVDDMKHALAIVALPFGLQVLCTASTTDDAVGQAPAVPAQRAIATRTAFPRPQELLDADMASRALIIRSASVWPGAPLTLSSFEDFRYAGGAPVYP